MITVAEDKNQYQKEHDEILTFLLNERFFKPWSNKYNNEVEHSRSLQPDAKLELYLTSSCNQKCEYCYLVKYKDLYPAEYNNFELIKHNLCLIYDWIINNDFCIPSMDFFTGEIWHLPFGLEVLDITLEYLKRGMQIENIMIPSNCSFVLDEIQTCEIQRRINRIRNIGCNIMFSISVDGAIIEEEMRPLNNKIVKTEEFYDRLFLFAKHNNYYFHPMVAAKSAKKWIENFHWWEQKLKEYDYYSPNCLMLLEVRNDDWTQENIDEYNQFMKFLIDYDIKNYYDNDVNKYVDCIIDYTDERKGYVPHVPTECDTFNGCTVADTLTIRVGDLAIAPCHRTSYNKFLYGHFIVENDEIVGMKSNNVFMAARILMMNNNAGTLGCDSCIYNTCCLKGCYGSQYETTNDPFIPIPSVCNLFKQKWNFIIKYYEERGILEAMKNKINPYKTNYLHAKRIYEWCLKVLEEAKNVG